MSAAFTAGCLFPRGGFGHPIQHRSDPMNPTLSSILGRTGNECERLAADRVEDENLILIMVGFLKRQVNRPGAAEMLKIPVAALAPKGNSFESEIETFLLGGPADGGFALLSEDVVEPVLGDNPAGQADTLVRSLRGCWRAWSE